jgi:hypothetical protein
MRATTTASKFMLLFFPPCLGSLSAAASRACHGSYSLRLRAGENNAPSKMPEMNTTKMRMIYSVNHISALRSTMAGHSIVTMRKLLNLVHWNLWVAVPEITCVTDPLLLALVTQ